MQTMRSKNRATLTLAGITLLVLAVGLIAYGLTQRFQPEVGGIDPLTEVAGPENGNALLPGEPVTGMAEEPGTTADAAPAINTDPSLESNTAVTPVLTSLGPVPETHVVQPDETLYAISMKYYNNHIYAGDIERLNEMKNPDHIVVGTVLKLPRPDMLVQGGQ